MKRKITYEQIIITIMLIAVLAYEFWPKHTEVSLTKSEQPDIIRPKLLLIDTLVVDTVPIDFDCFNQPVVFIKYRQLVNGYRVKVMWFPDGESGSRAILYFQRDDSEFYVYSDGYRDWKMQDELEEEQYVSGSVYEMDYVAKSVDEYLSDESPFFFSDVDFDGEEELLVSRPGDGEYGLTAYDVFDLISPYRVIPKTEPPFNRLVYVRTEFDTENKRIVRKSFGGWNTYNVYTYQGRMADIGVEDGKVETEIRFDLVEMQEIVNGKRIY